MLLGTDLVKSPERLWAAYNDAKGVTARFNLNMLTMINRELDADFSLHCFEHAADWDADNEWIDIRVRSTVAQTVPIRDLDMVVELAEGEEIRTEISAKFRLEGVAAELDRADLETVQQWTDDAGVTHFSTRVPPGPGSRRTARTSIRRCCWRSSAPSSRLDVARRRRGWACTSIGISRRW